MSQRISFDAEVVELRLPEDQRIRVRSVRELEKIAGILRKPILCEVVNGHPYGVGSLPSKNGPEFLAVYNGFWVYYRDIQPKVDDGEGSPQ